MNYNRYFMPCEELGHEMVDFRLSGYTLKPDCRVCLYCTHVEAVR